MHTTLNKILACSPDIELLEKLLAGLDKVTPDDEILPVRAILEICDLPETFWTLRAVDGFDPALRRLACKIARRSIMCFERVCPNDRRARRAIEITEKYADGAVAHKELKAARVAVAEAFRSLGKIADGQFHLVVKKASNITKFTEMTAATFAANSAWMVTKNPINAAVGEVAYSAAEALLYDSVKADSIEELERACDSDDAFMTIFEEFEPLLLDAIGQTAGTPEISHSIGVGHEHTFNAA